MKRGRGDLAPSSSFCSLLPRKFWGAGGSFRARFGIIEKAADLSDKEASGSSLPPVSHTSEEAFRQ